MTIATPLGIPGIHHITVVAGDPQRNLDFYGGVLGLRLVKTTVNFDAPDVYHFYYGDEVGHPGTILTFFPFPNAPKGRRGTGTVDAIAFSIPAGSLDYWTERLAGHGLAGAAPATRFGEPVLLFTDPDGLQLELIAHDADGRDGWAGGPVPAAHAIRGFHGATLLVRDSAPTARLLTDTMGFRVSGEEGRRARYATGEGGPGADRPRGGAGGRARRRRRRYNPSHRLAHARRGQRVALAPRDRPVRPRRHLGA